MSGGSTARLDYTQALNWLPPLGKTAVTLLSCAAPANVALLGARAGVMLIYLPAFVAWTFFFGRHPLYELLYNCYPAIAFKLGSWRRNPVANLFSITRVTRPLQLNSVCLLAAA
jgi:hypothetical protein